MSLPVSFPDGFLCIDRDVEPFENVGHSFGDTFTSDCLNLAVVLVKVLLKVIDSTDCLVQCFLNDFGVGFTTFKQVDDLLELVFYLVYQKCGELVISVHFSQ